MHEQNEKLNKEVEIIKYNQKEILEYNKWNEKCNKELQNLSQSSRGQNLWIQRQDIWTYPVRGDKIIKVLSPWNLWDIMKGQYTH